MNQQNGYEAPRLYHTMRCKDPEAMIAWLKNVLGFAERVAYRKEGTVVHAELAFGSSILMLGAHRDDAYAKRVGDIGGHRTDRAGPANSDSSLSGFSA
ncbi:putative glyoxalase superfamily protein PhnB [Bradyrhizobium diazoefficiens]